MNCPKCGRQNSIDSKVCSHCGARLEGISPIVGKHQQMSTSTPTAEMSTASVTESSSSPVTGSIPVETKNHVASMSSEPIKKRSFNKNRMNKQEHQKAVKKRTKRILKPKMKRMMMIGVIVVAVIAVVVILFKLFGGQKKTTEAERVFADDQFIIIQEGNKYGYIDSKGKVVIPPTYKNATRFYGDYALVYVDKNSATSSYPEGYHVIDKKGKIKFSADSSYGIHYVSEYDIWIINNQLYNAKLKLLSGKNVKVEYEENGYLSWQSENDTKSGIMRYDGKVTYTYRYQKGEDWLSITPSDADENLKDKYCIVNVENEKYAIVNCDTGKVAYNFTEYYISDDGNNIFEISDHDTYKDVYRIYIQGDKVAYQASGDSSMDYHEEGYIEIYDRTKDENRTSYFDIEAGKVTSERPVATNMSSLSTWEKKSGYTKFSCSSGYGLMQGEKVALPCEWSYIDNFDILLYTYLDSQGKPYVMARRDNKVSLVNIKNGKVEKEFNTTSLHYNSNSTFVYYTDMATNQVNVYNLVTGKSAVFKSVPSMYTNYIVIEENGKKNYYNMDLNFIYTEK